MKKVLFVIGSMEIGGTRTSLLNLLSFLSTNSNYSIDLFVLKHCGPLFGRVPKSIHIIPEQKIISDCLPGAGKKSLFGRLWHVTIVFFKKIFGYKKVFSWLFKKVSKKLDYYDVAIGFQEGITNDFSSFVRSHKHFFWIHNDYLKWFEKKYDLKTTYENADRIIFVANAAKDEFAKNNIGLKDKCVVIPNTLNVELIKEKSSLLDAPFLDSKKFYIVSVGRICEQKAYNRVFEIADSLVKSNLTFEWHVIGGGDELDSYRLSIEKHFLLNYVFFDGPSNNPYPYIKNANILAVTSIYESQPMVILEALSLGIPVVSTAYSSVYELLNNKKYGFVAQNIDEYIEFLKRIMTDKNEYKQMKTSAKDFYYNNQKIIDQICLLIDDE